MDQPKFIERVLSRLDRLDRAQIEALINSFLDERALAREASDALPLGAMLVDREGRIVWLNAAARRLLDAEDARRGPGETLARTFRPRDFDALRALWEDFSANPRRIEGELVPVRRGRGVLFEASLFPLGPDAAQPHHVLWVITDATSGRHRRAEEERARYLEFFTTLTAGLAHEIRNPLNSLSIHARLLDQGLGDLAGGGPPPNLERMRRSAEVLIEEIERLSEIVRMFLLAARPMKLDLQPVRVESLFEQAAELLGPLCRERGIRLKIENDPDLPPAPLDRQQMAQVVLNLAKNAIEAIEAIDGAASPAGTAKGGVRPALKGAEPRGQVTLRSRLEGDHLLIEVSDTGCGIPEDKRAIIFEPYYTTKDSGTGLGLMVVWRIVKAHGGAIALDSEVGKGTTFTIALPLGKRPVRLITGHVVKGGGAEAEAGGGEAGDREAKTSRS